MTAVQKSIPVEVGSLRLKGLLGASDAASALVISADGSNCLSLRSNYVDGLAGA